MRNISRQEVGYPLQLQVVPAAPDPLYALGGLVPEDALAVAVVGSRYPTAYGAQIAWQLGADLARRGITVVSGLARGIDIAAHRGALDGGGRTIAVLGSGVDVIYPAEHAPEVRAIVRRGAVVSPFPPGTAPRPGHFPTRNRVIAGLSLGVVVVEAAERSGSLITAGMAGDLGREVMAVPGRVTSPESRGTHRLIKEGAALVEGWEDVVAQLPAPWRSCVAEHEPAPGGVPPGGGATQNPGGDRDAILALLGEEAVGIEHIIEVTGLGPARVGALLAELQIEGVVRQLPGNRFARLARSGAAR